MLKAKMAIIGEKSISPSRKIGRRNGAKIGSEIETINLTQAWLGSGLIQESRIRTKITTERISKRILIKERRKLIIFILLYSVKSPITRFDKNDKGHRELGGRCPNGRKFNFTQRGLDVRSRRKKPVSFFQLPWQLPTYQIGALPQQDSRSRGPHTSSSYGCLLPELTHKRS